MSSCGLQHRSSCPMAGLGYTRVQECAVGFLNKQGRYGMFALERISLSSGPLCFSLEQIFPWMSLPLSHSVAVTRACNKDMILNTCCRRSCPLFQRLRTDRISPWLGFSPAAFMACSALTKTDVRLSLLFTEEPSWDHLCD